jgi:dihydrofolate reductase
MGELIVFNHVTLDGFFTDEKGDMSFAHHHHGDAEWNAFVEQNAGGGGALLFGRITYEMMAGYWPTAQAQQSMPGVAERMNGMPKVVFSRSLTQVSWSNTTLLHGDLVNEVRKLKVTSATDVTILGSGSIVAQLAPEGVIDEYQLIVNPIVLGKGRTMFDGVTKRVALQPTRSRTFRNGNILLCYVPKA